MTRSQLLKRADTLNEELGRPGAGSDTPDPEYQKTNPFNSKGFEENMVLPDPIDASLSKVSDIQQHEEPRCLPPREESRKHYDTEVMNELKADKEASLRRLAIDFTEVAQALNPSEVRMLRLVQKRSGTDPMQSMYPYSGLQDPNAFFRVINNLARKGWAVVKDNKIFKSEVTDRLIMTYDAMKTPGTVVSSMRFKAQLLNRQRRDGLPSTR